ncbi:MAG: PHP domain-containing protein [Candidatus Delongbacteria bacterium]|nr:PHP domain-containing protein [Candidatus Delongbacteria bacterium]MBN2834235.1 PHP domain-containing protein [Candidatus Delongbacteria bacterium]
MSGYCDFHIHSNFSDGLFTPERIFHTAKKKGVFTISITDHDIYPDFDWRYLSKLYSIMFYKGIELTSYHENTEVHVIGLNISNTSELKDHLRTMIDSRVNRAEKICENLISDGILVNKDTVLLNSNPGRPHIAKELVRIGKCYDFNDAFKRFLSSDSPYVVKKYKIDPKTAIDLIRKSGGLSFLAHPIYYLNDKEILDYLITLGFDGIEVFHSLHKNKEIEYFTNLAVKNHLYISGGSDCHGGIKNGKILIGKSKLPYHHYKSFKKKLECV